MRLAGMAVRMMIGLRRVGCRRVGSGLDLSVVVGVRVVNLVKMAGRQQPPAFQVFDRHAKFDSAPIGLATACAESCH